MVCHLHDVHTANDVHEGILRRRLNITGKQESHVADIEAKHNAGIVRIAALTANESHWPHTVQCETTHSNHTRVREWLDV